MSSVPSTGSGVYSLRLSHSMRTARSSGVSRTCGFGGGDGQESAELYDPDTDTWSPTDSMTTARSGHTMTFLGVKGVLVVGGQDGSGAPGGALASAERYDPNTNMWVSAGSLADARSRRRPTSSVSS